MTAEQDRLDWLARRRSGIGASDVAGLVRLSPWVSPWSLWADKVGLLPLDDDARPDFEYGHFMELAVGPWFEQRTGLHVAGEQDEVVHPELSWVRATLDGYVFESAASTDPLGGLEIKTDINWRRWDEIPAHYQCQAQWQMAAAHLERIWFAVLHGRRLEVYEIERDQADIDLLVDAATAFWHDHVLTGTPPAVDGSDATLDALKAVYPDHVDDKAVDLDDTVADHLAEYIAAKADGKAAEAREKAARAHLESFLGDAEAGLVDGQRVVSWRTQDARQLDKAALNAEHPELVKAFTVNNPRRVLRTHTPKEKR